MPGFIRTYQSRRGNQYTTTTMDFFRPGLLPNLIKGQICSNNTISAKILEQWKQLNDSTNQFLADVNDATIDLSSRTASRTSIDAIFSDFYYDFKIGDSKLTAIPDVSLATLKAYQKKVKDLFIHSDTDERMISIIGEYSMLLLVYHMSNNIIYQTVVAKGQLSYWTELKLSNYSKALYGVQTLPERVYRILSDAYEKNDYSLLSEAPTFPKRLALLVNSVKRLIVKSFGQFNVNYIIKQSKFAPLKMMFNGFDQEIKEKIKCVNSQLDEKYMLLGTILNNLPINTRAMSAIFPDADGETSSLIQCVEGLIYDIKSLRSTAPPSFWARYWPLIFVTINYGPSTSLNIWKNRMEILEWSKHNFLDTLVGFWSNWIVKPITDMLNILRNDDTMTITSKESLKSDLDSLERMVTDYLADMHVKASPAEIHSAVAQGDLTMMMSQYENEIRSPYKSVIKGLLIRSLLIQVQKTKVDGGLAINGIDKLLKLQQLLFGILSISPSLFILYQANNALKRDSTLSRRLVDRRFDCLKSMNQIEKLANAEGGEAKLIRDGKLFVEIVNLSLLSNEVIPKKLQEEFSHDMNQLALINSSDTGDLRGVINRIWNMYSPFYRK